MRRIVLSCGAPLSQGAMLVNLISRRCESRTVPPSDHTEATSSKTRDEETKEERKGEEEVKQSETAAASDTVAQVAPDGKAGGGEVAKPEEEPRRWVEAVKYEDPSTMPIVDEKGEYIVSRVQWPTGELAYTTPPPTDDKLAPRFGYNVLSVKKPVSWWQYNQKYPTFSFTYLNIQLFFLLGMAWLVAFLTTEYRRTTDAMRTPGAMVGEHRGRGPATNKTQKISFTPEEMSAMVDKAQNNWFDGKAEADYIGSKEYKMKSIPRPKEFSVDDFKKR